DELPQLVRIGIKGREVIAKVQCHVDASRPDAVPDKVKGRADDLIEIDRLFLRTALAGHRQEGLDDPAASLGGSPNLRGAPRAITAPLLIEHESLPDNDRQRVIELMCDAREQRSQRVDLFALVQAVALACDLFLRFLLLREIAEMGREEIVSTAPCGRNGQL